MNRSPSLEEVQARVAQELELAEKHGEIRGCIKCFFSFRSHDDRTVCEGCIEQETVDAFNASTIESKNEAIIVLARSLKADLHLFLPALAASTVAEKNVALATIMQSVLYKGEQ